MSLLVGILPLKAENVPLQPDVTFPSQTAIKEHQKYVAYQLQKKAYIKTGTQYLMGLSCIAACYVLFKSYRFVDTTQLGISDNQLVKNLATVVAEELPHRAADLSASPVSTVRSWFDLLGNLSLTLAQGFAFTSLHQFVVNQLLFPKTPFAWFLDEHTTLLKVYQEINVLKNDINCAKEDPASVTMYQADRYVTRLIFLSNGLIAEGQKVIGYFNHRYDHMLIQGKQPFGDDKSGIYLYDRMNLLAQRMHELRAAYLQHTTYDERITTIAAMVHEIDACGAELNSTTASFNRFDAQLAAA